VTWTEAALDEVPLKRRLRMISGSPPTCQCPVYQVRARENLSIAMMLGLDVPPMLLARAD